MTSKDLETINRLFVNQLPICDGVESAYLKDLLLNVQVEEVYSVIRNHQMFLVPVCSNNLPQFSNADDIYRVLRIVIDSELSDLSYEKIGYFLCKRGAKTVAQLKYGENHYKLAAQLGLVTASKPFTATTVGKIYYTSEEMERQLLKKKLALRIPIIQQALILADTQLVDMTSLVCNYLSETTMLRRRSNIKKLLSFLMDISDTAMQRRLNNLVWR